MHGTSTMGEILRPGDAAYEAARRVWNGTVDRHPALIVRPRTSEEIAAAVRMATASGLEIAVRGGGHSIPGLSVCEGGMMLDLSEMKSIEVDTDARVARAQPGLLWGDFDAATQTYGLASPGGEISHTGIAGLTLGGGIGWLSRKYGLACDNMIGATVVFADGTVADVDDVDAPDLMWGLRGGGGNFGIVSEFRYRVHEVGPVYAGMVAWPASETQAVLGRYVAIAKDAPRDLALVAVNVVAPPAPFVPEELHFQPIVVITAMWTGDAADGPEATAAIRAGNPSFSTFDVHDYCDVQRWFDDGMPHGRRYHVRSEWLGELDEGAVAALDASACAMTSPFNQILVRRLGGAAGDVAADATAFRYRDAAHMLTIVSGWDEGDDAPHVAWTRESWQRLQPWSCGGSYVNHLAADEGASRVREAYGQATWDRLVALKRQYDPDNVFHLNQNINPM